MTVFSDVEELKKCEHSVANFLSARALSPTKLTWQEFEGVWAIWSILVITSDPKGISFRRAEVAFRAKASTDRSWLRMARAGLSKPASTAFDNIRICNKPSVSDLKSVLDSIVVIAKAFFWRFPSGRASEANLLVPWIFRANLANLKVNTWVFL